MRIKNNMRVGPSMDQIKALEQVKGILEAAFNKEVFGACLNPRREDESDIYGVSFSFSMRRGD